MFSAYETYAPLLDLKEQELMREVKLNNALVAQNTALYQENIELKRKLREQTKPSTGNVGLEDQGGGSGI